MSEVQKLIKYFAIAFAAFIIVNIFVAIYYVGFELGNTIINIPSDNEKVDINSFDNDVSVLNVDINCSKLIIKTGEKLKVETNHEYVTSKRTSNKISIMEKRQGLFKKIKNNEVILYIPENMKFDQVFRSNGAGTIDIEALVTENIELEIGAGKVTIDSLIVNDEADIESGAGEVIISNSKINNLELDMGVGKFTLNSILTGSNKIDAGIGSLNINLLDSKDNYKIKLSKGLGSISIDDNNVKDDKSYGNGSSLIDIDGGIGSINVQFK